MNELLNPKYISLKTKVWGPPTWFFLHSVSFTYPNNPSDQDKNNYKIFFESISNILPCSICSNSYKKYIIENDTNLSNFLDSRKSLSFWLYLIHNKVNKKLKVNNKLIPTYEEVVLKYSNFISQNKNPLVCNLDIKENFNNKNNTSNLLKNIIIIILIIIIIILLICLLKKNN